jgi:ATP-dependent RNA circularization protein (DNA/RNA ligase family)
MREYHKINSLFKRGDKGEFLFDKFSTPEFEYLYKNGWIGTEKIDGRNTRIHWDGEKVALGGRTENSQIPAFLVNKLQELTDSFNWQEVFPDADDVTLFGEGYGAKIQKPGKLYKPDGVDFILFDVKIGHWWLKREAVNEIAEKFGIDSVPIIFRGTLEEAIEVVKNGFDSSIGTAKAEGMVLVPSVDLFARNGNRIITKLKTKDFS